ncbi:MAG: hypothetical protein FWB73_04580 [Treponema sp.]|nr:hypothetical protein [Treponema sp.]
MTKATDTGLAVGNRIVSGLNPNKYYMIKKEHWDLEVKEAVNLENGGTENILHGSANILIDGILFAEDEPEDDPEPEPEYEKILTSTEFGFVSEAGKIVEKLENIGKSDAVTGLTNYRTDRPKPALPYYTEYTITSAKPLSEKGQLFYYENLPNLSAIDADPAPVKKPFPSNGKLTPPTDGTFHFLDISDCIPEVETGVDFSYEKPFAIDQKPEAEKLPPSCILTGNILQLSRSCDTVDYLFLGITITKDEDNIEIAVNTEFRILTVYLVEDEEHKLQPDGTVLIFSIEFSGPEENMLNITITPNETEITQSQGGGTYPLIFGITNSSEYTDYLWCNDVDGPAASETTQTYTLDFWSDLKYQVAGKYKIYVSAMFIETGEYHSAVVEIEVVTQ